MSLTPLRGHREARALLARAAAAGDLAQSLLLHGPPGVGKERLALWLAQLLVCESPLPGGEPCGRCAACRLTLRLEHPDIHWFFPLPRPEAGSPEKLREKLEELRASELQARRANPHHLPAHDRPPAHFLAAVQTLQRLAAVRPALGSRKVFVVGDAELMVPQESSPEAANAFLKLLEEPPAGTTLILTSSQPGALLPTIRSRVLPLRVGTLDEPEIRAFLHEELQMAGTQAERIARLARGSIGRALRLIPGPEGPGPLERQRQAARTLLLAALSLGAVPRFAAALDQAPAGARGDFLGCLDALAEWLADLLAVTGGAAEAVADPEARQLLQRATDQHRLAAENVANALDRVSRARALALGNVNPQLIVAELLRGMQADLVAATAGGAVVARSRG